LVTLLTAYSLRSRAGFLSHRQRSWDLPFGGFPSRKVFGTFPSRRAHLPFNLAVFPPPKRRAGPIGRGSWVLPFQEFLATRQGFSLLPAGSSLGFHPSRVLRRKPWPGFRPASSHALRGLGKADPAGAPEYQSASARPYPCAVPEYGPDKATLLGFLHQLDPAHFNEFLAWLWVHLSPCRALLPTSR
jgi:hypothetical protein